MVNQLRHSLPFAAGAAIGGLFIGTCEGFYREVSLTYAALLYGSFWAFAGLGGALAIAIVFNREPRNLVAWGISLSASLSTAVLARFILLRDFLGEAPAAGMKASLAAIGLAFVVGCVLFAVSRLGTKFLDHPTVAFVITSLVIGGFVILAQRSEPSAPMESQATKAQPNKGVILVVVDTLRADALGIYGATPSEGKAPSPFLDAFAQSNTLFTDMSAQASWTKPAMASIHTSRHVSGHNTMSKTDALPDKLTTLAETLQQAGIQTGAVVTNYNLEKSFGFSQGFDHYAYLPPDRYLGAPPHANRLAAYNVYRLLREKLLPSKREARHFYQDAAVVNRRGLSMLDSLDSSKPFFLWLHYMEPHDPYFASDGSSYARVSSPNPPPDWASKMKTAYKEDVHRFDQFFGSLLKTLSDRGLGNISVVLTSDHGEEFYEHGGFYHGVTLYEEQLKLPLIIKQPGRKPEVRQDLARQIDIAPTIAGLLGVGAPTEWEGRDLFGETPPPSQTIAEENHQGNILQSIRQLEGQGLKLILANDDNPRGLAPSEVYALAQDPGEKHSLTTPTTTLKTALRTQQEAAKRGGAIAQKRELDAEAEAELRSLGYIE